MEKLEILDEQIFLPFNSEKLHREKIERSIKTFEELVSQLSSEEKATKILEIAYEFFSYGTFFDLANIPVLDFLKKYDIYVPIEKEIQIYFSLDHYEIAESYIQYNLEKIRKSFHMNYLIFERLDSSEDDFGIFLPDYQYAAWKTYNKKVELDEIYIISKLYRSDKMNYLLYKYFKDDLFFLFDDRNKNDLYYAICYRIDSTYLAEILRDLYLNHQYKDFLRVSTYFQLEEDIESLEQLTSLLVAKVKNDKSFSVNLEQLELWSRIPRECVAPNHQFTGNLFSESYQANLNYLKNLPRRERRTNLLYQQCLELFISNFSFYQKGEAFLFERVFMRMIEEKDFFQIVLIEDLKSFYHYYKTNEFLQIPKNISLENIKNYHTKQYLEIKELLKIKREKTLLMHTRSEQNLSLFALKLLSFFGYEQTKKMLISDIFECTLEKIMIYSFLNQEEKNAFLKMIYRDLDTFYKNQDNISAFLKLFTLHYPVNHHITLYQLLKRMDSLEYILLPNNYHILKNLQLLDFVSKGKPINEKLSGIELYDLYRMRKYSSIPNIKGIYHNFSYETVDMNSPEIISNGIGEYLYPEGKVASSCLTPAGKASSCLYHGATNEQGRFFKVMLNDRIVAYSWMWRRGDVLCFDNIEVTKEFLTPACSEELLLQIYKEVSNKIIDISKNTEERPLKVVIVGKNKIDQLKKIENLPNVSEFRKEPFTPSLESLYLEDSKEQHILAGDITEEINLEDVTPVYTYERKKVQAFKELSKEELKERIQSIYFDYCLYTNQKYENLNRKYISGYIGEDWFIGYEKEGYDLFYRAYSEEMENEISNYVQKKKIDYKKAPIILGTYPDISYFLKDENYQYNESLVEEYLLSLNDYFKGITDKAYYHTSHDLKRLGCILYDKAITSSFYGKRDEGYGSNGNHFISIASVGTSLYHSLEPFGFIIKDTVQVFPTNENFNQGSFKYGRYPLRTKGLVGESQVLDYISLDCVKAIQTPKTSIIVGKICYLQEYFKNELPLVLKENYCKVDQKEIKRLIKLK